MEFNGKAAPGVPKNQDQNMKELLNLLGPSTNNAPPPQQQVQAQAHPQAANPRAVEMQSAATVVQPKQQQTAIARAHFIRQQQIQQQRLQREAAIQKQRAAAATAPTPSSASQGVVNELEEILRANQTAPQAPRPQAQPQQVVPAQRRPVSSTNRSTASVASGASSLQQQAAQPNNNRRMPAPNQPAASGRTNPTQEQVIVGHFCRHALACLTRLTADLANSAELQGNLKTAIKRLWAEWVANNISKTALLETVARIVRGSCPAAASINVISEFRAWYHQQLSVQRTNRAGRGNPPAPSAGALAATVNVRQAGVPQATAAAQAAAGYQFATRTQGVASNQHIQQAIAAGMGNIGAAQAKASVIRGRPINAKQEKAAYGSKSIPQKTVAAKTVQRNGNVASANPGSVHAQAILVQQQRAAALNQMAQQQHAANGNANGNMRQARPGVRAKVGLNVKNEQLLHANMAAVAGGNVNMAGKRLADPTAELSLAAQKKARAGGKFQKSPSKVRKTVQGMGVPGVAMMPPMGSRIAMIPGRVNPNAIPAGNVARFAPGAIQQAVRPGVGMVQPVASDPKKTSKKTIDNDLNVVDSIVNIDNETETLLGGSQIIHELNMHESEDFSSLLLNGRVLRGKIEKTMAKHGLTGAIPKDVIELIAHACKERLSYVFENVAQHANARVEPIKTTGEFVSRDPKKDVRGILEKMREDEERSLVAAAKRRTQKWRKEEEEKRAREAAADTSKTEGTKSDKAAQQEADKKKKAKAAVEKKKAADSLQRSALSGAISGITKKRKKKANLAPLKLGMGAKSVSGKTTSNGANMALSTTAIAAGTSNPGGNIANSNTGDKPNGSKVGGEMGGTAAGKKTVALVAKRTAIKLEDCLAFFGAEPNMKQSALVYKWYTRLHAPPVKVGNAQTSLIRKS